jgi:hypothetical protein
LRAKLQRPYDFLVVSDHAENLGLAPMIAESNAELLKTAFGRLVHDLVKAGKGVEAYEAWIKPMNARQDPLKGQEQMARSMWQRLTAAAEQYNEPGHFTAFIGFEWTAMPGGNNLHRNVIFRDGKDKADQIIPFSQYDSIDPEDLWTWMATYEQQTGGKLLAIPHNGNLSNGLMFDDVTLTTKKPLDRDYAERRMRWEPVYEVTQMKGDGEAHPALSPTDEFANFETWDKGSFGPEAKTRPCCRASTRGRRSSAAWPTRRNSGSTRSSSAWSARPMPTRPCPRRRRTTSSARWRCSRPRRSRTASMKWSRGASPVRTART